MRRIATSSALAAVLVLTAAAPAPAASIRSAAIQPSHVSDPSSFGDWIEDVERPSAEYRAGR
jgi:hypothetical protein